MSVLSQHILSDSRVFWRKIECQIDIAVSWYRWLNNYYPHAEVNEQTRGIRARETEEIESLPACDAIDPDGVS